MKGRKLKSEENNRAVEIKTARDFCNALNILLRDPEFPEENLNTKSFVEAMQAWLLAFEGRNSLFDQPCEEYITWADLYKLLQAAAVYE